MSIETESDVFNLDDEEFSKLTPDQIRAQAESEEDDTDHDQEEHDDVDEDQSAEDDESDNDEDDSSEDDNNDEESDSDEAEDDQVEVDAKTTQAPAKADKVKGKVKAEPTTEVKPVSLSQVELQEFYTKMTGKIKASGQEFSFDKPEDLISLAQKGIDYTQKMQQVSELRGVGAILKEHQLLDPAKISYLIDLHNHKPEAIAKLLQESGHDAYDLDEAKANSYVNQPVDFESTAKAADVKQIVADNESDPKFMAMFSQARTWDDESQRTLVANPQYLEMLGEHARNGVYEKVMQEVQRERILNGSKEPLLQTYHRIGFAMYGESDQGGSAQVPQTRSPVKQANNQPVIVKRKTQDVERMRAAASSTKSTSKKATKSTRVQSTADIFSMSDEDFKKLDLNKLRKEDN